jgi:hypothetical protein
MRPEGGDNERRGSCPRIGSRRIESHSIRHLHPPDQIAGGITVDASGTVLTRASLTNLTLHKIMTIRHRFSLQFYSKCRISFARQGFVFHLMESGWVIGDAALIGAIVHAGASGRSIFFSERGRGHDVSVLG